MAGKIRWQYHMIKLVSRCICLLPYTVLLPLGRLLGKLYYRLVDEQRDLALTHIKECLGLSQLQAEEMVKKCFIKLGQTFLEVMYMPALTPVNIKEFVEIENSHYLANALADKRGVIFLTAHVGNWEWMGAALAMAGFPMTGINKRQPNDQADCLLNEYRQMVGIELFSRGTTELVAAAKALKQGKVLAFLVDQDAGYNGVFMDFLGKMASTPLGPAVFAKRFKCPIVPAFVVRRPEGGHRVIVSEPFYYEDTGDEGKDLYCLTLKMTDIVTQTIRQYPDEWLWFQKRWNTPYEAYVTEPDKYFDAGTKERLG